MRVEVCVLKDACQLFEIEETARSVCAMCLAQFDYAAVSTTIAIKLPVEFESLRIELADPNQVA
jgi:hypothetical protein